MEQRLGGAGGAPVIDQQSSRAGAIHVIIAKNGDRLAPFDGVGQTQGGGVHVL